jgi:transcriptional regulator of nitric oxide reductase
VIWAAACVLGVALAVTMAVSLARSAARADRAAARGRDEFPRGWVVDPASPPPPIGRSLIGDDADRDALLDQVFPPTRAEGKDVP